MKRIDKLISNSIKLNDEYSELKMAYDKLSSDYEKLKNGETLVTIGKLLGISDASVSRRLSGQTDWKISEIETLCEKFDKSYCELFEIIDK